MRADLEYVSKATTFVTMKFRLEECEKELREKQRKMPKGFDALVTVKEILGKPKEAE